MDSTRLHLLFDKFLRQDCSDDEQAELDALLDDPDLEPAVKDMIDQVIGREDGQRLATEESSREILEAIFRASGRAPIRKLPSKFKKWWPAAASIALLLTAGVYFFLAHRHTQVIVSANNHSLQNDIAPPAGTKAILTLGNGQQIILDSAQNGQIAQQGSTNIEKVSNGQLAYSPLAPLPPLGGRGKGGRGEMGEGGQSNTLSTPRGGFYELKLPDGTKVWLNALSSLRFPTAFTGKERLVDLTGEAYFEVAPNAKMPFRVNTGRMTVKVLGTHFNINAYEDEQVIKTTLFEGSVKVSEDHTSRIIAPGEQAILSTKTAAGSENPIRVSKDADPDEVLAWKNGFFQFDRLDMEAIMRQVGRWYDVDLSYEGGPPVRKFSGIVSRKANLSEVMRIMGSANIHFRIEGRRLILTP